MPTDPLLERLARDTGLLEDEFPLWRGLSLAQMVFGSCAARAMHWFLYNRPEAVTCLRSVPMKPEHASWLDGKWERLAEASSEVMGS